MCGDPPKLGEEHANIGGGPALVVPSKERLEALLVECGFAATLGSSSAAPLAAGSPVALRVRPGVITELVPEGSTGAGITSLALHLAAGHAGNIGWVDPADHLDPASVDRAGIAFSRLRWLRGGVEWTAMRAGQLILQAGG